MRKWLLAGLSLLLMLCGIGIGGVTWLLRDQTTNTVGKVEFDRRLAVPPLAPSHVDAQGRRVFELTAGFGHTDFGHGRTATWGYNGTYLGPTLRATRGEQVLVNVHNSLADDTTVHWHGMHLPARMDGGPAFPIGRGFDRTDRGTSGAVGIRLVLTMRARLAGSGVRDRHEMFAPCVHWPSRLASES